MWFVYVAAGLVVVTIGGLYARRRLAEALAHLGVSSRRVRVVRWLMTWLLFGFPVLVISAIAISRLLGRPTVPRFDGRLAGWLLGAPFVLAVLVVVQSVPWLVAIDVAHAMLRRRSTAARLRAAAVIAVVGVFALYTPLRVLAGRDALRVRHHHLGIQAQTTSPPFRIGFLSDVHQDVHTRADRVHEVYALINGEHPDLVLSGGDWISTGPDHIEAAATSAAELTSRLGTFSVRGDHEHFAYVDRERSVAEVEQAMRRHGVAMLNNEVRWFDHNGKHIAVVFLNNNYIHRTDGAAIAALISRTTGADYTIAVTHQLDRGLAAQLENKVDLVLAGHTHGGQINPVLGIVHVNLARLETELVDGRYDRGRTTFVVTAGIGYSIVPLRYAAPGSIELIDVAL